MRERGYRAGEIARDEEAQKIAKDEMARMEETRIDDPEKAQQVVKGGEEFIREKISKVKTERAQAEKDGKDLSEFDRRIEQLEDNAKYRTAVSERAYDLAQKHDATTLKAMEEGASRHVFEFANQDPRRRQAMIELQGIQDAIKFREKQEAEDKPE